ncbi:hypothetical protein B0J11DRAFT_574549 [Dendryphion nanum]|uniref:Uncharacterized protein n=1 Tax=Dendryphion nanum TaxID=256645 RepID=A0A9P9EKK9_9PLEO|nr:hypothetical protein B0J11DRAFT_574549 [Dendryphion nanum]
MDPGDLRELLSKIVQCMIRYRTRYGFLSNYNSTLFLIQGFEENDNSKPCFYFLDAIQHTDKVDANTGTISLRLEILYITFKSRPEQEQDEQELTHPGMGRDLDDTQLFFEVLSLESADLDLELELNSLDKHYHFLVGLQNSRLGEIFKNHSDKEMLAKAIEEYLTESHQYGQTVLQAPRRAGSPPTVTHDNTTRSKGRRQM